MLDSSSQPIVDLYPIVMELDEETVGYGSSSSTLNLATNNGSLYDAVASEASWFASERSWMLVDEEDKIETEMATREKEPIEEPGEVGSPAQWRRKVRGGFLHHSPPSTPSPRRTRNRSYGPSYHHDCDDEWNSNCQKNNNDDCDDSDVDGESTTSGGVFANLRSLLQMGSNRHHNNNRRIRSIETHPAPEEIPFMNVSPLQSPIRVGTKRNRSCRFHDEYVLTQQIVRCRIATLWECVHRPTGRRYCAKAIDKRRFASPADRAMAVREITMHRSIIDQQFSPTCHLPRIRDIFADEEAAEPTPTQQHDECKSSASCCSGSTMSISSHSHSACDDSNNHNNNFWYIVQDFEAGGENLRLYLLGRENSIFNVPEKGGDDYGGNEMSSNELHALAEASRAASNIMQESEVRSLARSLLLAVKGLHDRSICHNDLCPENVLVLFSATTNHHNDNDCWEALKLCDLGRSFFVDDTAINDTTNGDGSTVGDIPQHSSIYYTSPEVLLGKPPGLASDMWSVGVILYRCFAGELPFQEQREDNTRLAYSCSASVSSSSTKGSIAKMLRQQLKREICQADCKFMRSRRRKTDRRWSRVSRGAKQFLSTLLNRDPSVRMTCGEALKHPWLQMNGIITAPSSPPNRSCSMISSSLPIVPSLTSTNHYHHHPQYSTTGVTKMNEGDYSHHHQEEDAGELDISPTISSSAESAGGSQSTDDSSRSVQTRLKSFVHKCFGRLKSSNNNHNRVSADAQFVID